MDPTLHPARLQRRRRASSVPCSSCCWVPSGGAAYNAGQPGGLSRGEPRAAAV